MRALPAHTLVIVDVSPPLHDPSGRATSYTNQPLVPLPQIAGPSRPRDHQTSGDHPPPASLDQDNLLKAPGWYATPILIGSPYQNHPPYLGSPVLGEVGPSRSPAVRPATRHRPYPQSRPQQWGFHATQRPVRSQPKGKGNETLVNDGFPIPNTRPQGNRLEVCLNDLRRYPSSNTVCKFPTPTTRLRSGTFVELLKHPGMDPRDSRSPSILSQWSPAPQYPTNAILRSTFRRPATAFTQEHRSLVDSTQESEGSMTASHTRPTRLGHQRLQATVTGPCGPAVYLSTLPMGTKPDGPLPNRPKCSPHRLNQNRRAESRTPAAARTPSPRHAAQQVTPHPYPHPENVRQQALCAIND